MKSKSTPGSAWETAINILSRKDHSREELRLKLVKRKYPDSEIDLALRRCQEFGYINDERYAEKLIRYLLQAKKFSNWVIKKNLEQRGIDCNIIDEVFARMHLTETVTSEEQRLQELLSKKFPDGIKDERIRQKAIRFLASRGYGWELIEKVIFKN